MRSKIDSVADINAVAQLDSGRARKSFARRFPGGSQGHVPAEVRPSASPDDRAEGVHPSAGERARRAINFVAALALLALSSPLMLLVAFLIKATSPGPVLYKQPRVGLDRREGRDRREAGRHADGRRSGDSGGMIFTIYKFRTMYACDGSAPQVWAEEDDPRITPIGSVLRKYRLDELPQLFNILRGEMNLVGPRPEQPVIFDELRGQIDVYPHRQKVLPGITGWAQVNQAYDQNLDDVRRKVSLDLEYLERRSVSEDLKIMARTLPVMILKKGSM